MKNYTLLLISFFVLQLSFAQKKSLDHSVYDGWQSVGERRLSNDGKWIVYSVNPQEGDNDLIVQSSDLKYKFTIPRGYSATVSEDNKYLLFRIKPLFKEVREARIKKKRPDDMPKDSLGILILGTDSIWKTARVKNFRTPEESFGWVAYHLDKPIASPARRAATGDSKKVTDSLTRIIDSLHNLLLQVKEKKSGNRDQELELTDAEGDESTPSNVESGTILVLRSLINGQELKFANVLDYQFNKKGSKLVIEKAKDPKDSTSRSLVLLYDLRKSYADTLSRGGNDFRNFAFSEDGSQVAFLGERDAPHAKTLQKFYKLWYHKEGMDSAIMLVDRNTEGMEVGLTVSEFGNLSFSKSGRRLFFGTAPIFPPKDTTLIDIDLVKVDIWHYNDDYLQTQQLSRLNRDLQENYLCVVDLETNKINQLGSRELPIVYQTNEGDGEKFLGVTDFGKRVEGQWAGNTRKDLYSINVMDGSRKLIKKDVIGLFSSNMQSPTGKYFLWYETKAKNYFSYDGDSIRNITGKIKTALYNEENDVPNDPFPYGIMGWHENDSAVYVYDRYDVWIVDPKGKSRPQMLKPFSGRASKTSLRYLRTNPEERAISRNSLLLFRTFNEKNKTAGYWINKALFGDSVVNLPEFANCGLGQVVKAKNSDAFIFTKESYMSSPDLYYCTDLVGFANAEKLTSLNPQQKDFNWGTAELYKWKAFDGKPAEGILYKPEDFDPDRKYPVIFYFYETHSNDLYDYIPPTPTGSRLNISYFVSNGYIVFSPDIKYKIGHPAKSAYNYVVSAAKDLATKKWVDAKNMAIQGQSWGGIQVAQLVTMTDMFKAAWSGAPVANMTSAYGGIRWESGANRQFQYEKTQSRIGATLWEKPELYIENSPLFHLPKVKTPMVIMHNDADGAVPWYQGIELFTGLRRLGKKVWMLNYNGEAHNLVERKNKKDIQMRQQQFFDYMLKGAKPARWITDGVPAVMKGRDLGLEL